MDSVERCAVCDEGDTDYVCDQCAELPPDYDGRHRPQEQRDAEDSKQSS